MYYCSLCDTITEYMHDHCIRLKREIDVSTYAAHASTSNFTLDMTTSFPDFFEFPKMSRLFREIVITEKIDGTNVQVAVLEDGRVLAGSRTRWITPEDDNFGFATWVRDHEDELRGLGEGRHFGEWWGRGIQQNYGLDHRRFSLFNTSRWSDDAVRPSCCHVVPVLYTGIFSEDAIRRAATDLETNGSKAAPGFMKPEGVVVYHVASNKLHKYTPYYKSDGHKTAKAINIRVNSELMVGRM